MKLHEYLPRAVASPIMRHLSPWHPATVAHRPRHANCSVEPNGHSFDDSRHPVWAIANGIAVFFLGTLVVGSLLLIADAFLTRT